MAPLPGFVQTSWFYKRVLDKLRIRVEDFSRGQFKSSYRKYTSQGFRVCCSRRAGSNSLVDQLGSPSGLWHCQRQGHVPEAGTAAAVPLMPQRLLAPQSLLVPLCLLKPRCLSMPQCYLTDSWHQYCDFTCRVWVQTSTFCLQL